MFSLLHLRTCSRRIYMTRSFSTAAKQQPASFDALTKKSKQNQLKYKETAHSKLDDLPRWQRTTSEYARKKHPYKNYIIPAQPQHSLPDNRPQRGAYATDETDDMYYEHWRYYLHWSVLFGVIVYFVYKNDQGRNSEYMVNHAAKRQEAKFVNTYRNNN